MAVPTPEQFQGVLQQILAEDDGIRERAANMYKGLVKSNPPGTVDLLIKTISGCKAEAGRLVAAVLLRKLLFTQGKPFGKLSPAVHAATRASLVGAFQRETSHAVRCRIGNCIAQLTVCTPAPWPELFPVVTQAAGHSDPSTREAGMHLLSCLVILMADRATGHAKDILNLCMKGMQPGNSSAVVLAAIQSLCTFASNLDGKADRERVQPAFGRVMSAVGGMVKGGNDEDAALALGHLSTLAAQRPDVFQPHLANMLRALTGLAKTTDRDQTSRNAAMEFLVSMAVSAGGMARAVPGFANETLLTCLQLMTEVDDDSAWVSGTFDLEGDESGEDDSGSPQRSAEAALYRLANALGYKAVLPVILPALSSTLSRDSTAPWQRRRAAAAAVGIVAASMRERAQDVDLKQRVAMAAMVAQRATPRAEPHPRVRHAALGALSCIGQSFAAKIEDAKKHQKGALHKAAAGNVFPILAMSCDMKSGNPPRVCAQAATAIVDWAHPEFCPASCLAPHADKLIGGLVPLLKCGKPEITSAALTATSNVANAIGDEAFAKYYKALMPGVRSLITSSSSDGDAVTQMKARAVECIGLLCQAVGKETFSRDADGVLSLLLRSEVSKRLLGDSLLRPAVIGALMSIAKVLEGGFSKYLPAVLPRLLDYAKQEVEFTSSVKDETTGGEATKEDGVSSMTMEFLGSGVAMQLNLNTQQVQDKTMALEALHSFVQDMGKAIGPHAKAIAGAVLPCIGFKSFQEVRAKASLCAAELLGSYMQHLLMDRRLAPDAVGREALPLASQVMKALQDAAVKEHSTLVKSNMCDALRLVFIHCLSGGDEDIIEYVHSSKPLIPLPPAVSDRAVGVLSGIVKESLDRREAQEKEVIEQGDVDEEALEFLDEMLEDEKELTTECIDALGYICKNIRGAYLPLFKKYLHDTWARHLTLGSKFGIARLSPQQSALYHNALCQYVDLVEWCGPPALAVLPALMPELVAGLGSDDEEIRMVCCYGVGIVAERQPAPLAPKVGVLLRVLHSVVSSEGAREEENNLATENAVSSMGKLMMQVLPKASPEIQGAVPKDKIWTTWLQNLPIRDDEPEAKYCHDLMVKQARAKNPAFCSPAAVQQVVRVGATVLCSVAGGGGDDEITMARPETCKEIAALLRDLRSSGAKDAVQAAWQRLPPAMQGAVEDAIRRL